MSEDRQLFARAFMERADGDEGPVVFTASTPGVKRDGLDLRASGWRLENYQRNPVFQWAHGRTSPPIGRVTASIENDRLRAAVEFDREDPFAVQVESKYRRGFLNAVSVGWDFVDSEGRGIDWWRLSPESIRDDAFYDLTELSGVPVPADPSAVAERQRAALRSLGHELVDLFDEQEQSPTVTADALREAVHAELQRLGIPLASSAPDRDVDVDAARNVLAAFPSLEGDTSE